MEMVGTIEAVRALVKAARSAGKSIGFVPTMGALHAGHVALIKAAVGQADFVVVSVFVNPAQFGPGEDFEKYPRPLAADIAICERSGADVVFAPAAAEIYLSDNLTWVSVDKLSELLCGRSRPGFFRGVATVCTKLFNIVQPDIAFFGQKDAQQAVVIKRMVQDLNMPLKIVVCPTVRQPSGLAESSRNQYLSEQQKKDAAVLYAALRKCEKMIRQGITSTESLVKEMRNMIEQVPSASIDYISIVDAESLQQLPRAEGRVLVALAVQLGPARLIDNIVVELER
jgi:pantoate--beta-alanine ligase